MDDPKQLINRFVEELWNERRLEVADAIFAKDCVTHQLRSGVPVDAVPRGPQVIKEHVAGWIASFPDLRFSIEQMLSEGDRVVTQLLMEGTHQGAWLGIPASGKKMQIRTYSVHRVFRGKFVEARYWKALGDSSNGLSEHSRLGGQFLASARQLLIPGRYAF